MLQKNKPVLSFSLFVLGFSSLFFQIYLLRDFLRVFQGNELVIGIVLSNWMILTATGAYLGRLISRMKNKTDFIRFIQLLFTLVPLLTIFKIDLWGISLPAGSIVGITKIITVSFLIQLPFCLMNGFLFSSCSYFSSTFFPSGKYSIPYALESAGSFAGGFVVNFILLWWFDVYNGLRILFLINLAVCFIQSLFLGKKKEWMVTAPLAVFAGIGVFLLNPEKEICLMLFPEEVILTHTSTPYGTVSVTQREGQLNFYENGLFLHSSGNEISNEESVHFPMLQRPNPQSVLVISGDLPGMAAEILKYPVKNVDLLEINPALVKTEIKYSRFSQDPRVHIQNKDGRFFIKRNIQKYDVIIVCLPGPYTLQLNRFYSEEFFREIKSRMNPDAVFSISLPASSNYVSQTSAGLNGSVFNTLKAIFPEVRILPGQKNYFLASDKPLSTQIASLINLRKITAIYVNPYFFDDGLETDRSLFIEKNLEAHAPVNRDFHPVAFFAQLAYWSSYFRSDYLFLAIVTGLLLILILASLNVVSVGMFTGGFTASSVELLLMISFQVIYGYLYQVAGVIIMLFMAGLALGAYFARKVYKDASVGNYLHIQITMALYCLGFPFIILGLDIPGIPEGMIWGGLGLLTLLVSLLTGFEFYLASELRKQSYSKVISENYSADLFGSAFGALLTGILFFPLMGIIKTGLILAGINMISAILLLFLRKKAVSL
ncbi:MAG: hypothetical protein Q8867_07095 [Bacteroidota bacterium]|nr:hypothetical protein [Bacteroidota bacterium]